MRTATNGKHKMHAPPSFTSRRVYSQRPTNLLLMILTPWYPRETRRWLTARPSTAAVTSAALNPVKDGAPYIRRPARAVHPFVGDAQTRRTFSRHRYAAYGRWRQRKDARVARAKGMQALDESPQRSTEGKGGGGGRRSRTVTKWPPSRWGERSEMRRLWSGAADAGSVERRPRGRSQFSNTCCMIRELAIWWSPRQTRKLGQHNATQRDFVQDKKIADEDHDADVCKALKGRIFPFCYCMSHLFFFVFCFGYIICVIGFDSID